MAAFNKCSKNVLSVVNKYSPQIYTRRHLNLQEYHSKDLLRKHQVSIQDFRVIDSSLDLNCLSDFKADEYVIKAQIPAGGRAKGQFDHGFKGGVHLTKKPEEILDLAKNMIGHKLVTSQTTEEGILVDKVMVAESVNIKRETYLSFMLDRAVNGAVLLASPSGGVDIETIAENSPHLLKTIPVDIYEGITDNIANEAAEFLQFNGPLRLKCIEEIKKLWQLFLKDVTHLEINPFVETVDERIVAVDAKLEFDNYAFYRQKDIFALEDLSKIETRVREAAALNLVYVNMDGNVGCMSNGAGVCMSTIDLVALNGGRPANFLDLGGKIGPAEVFGALRILESDPKVKSVFINVFAGIVNCITVAEGIIEACKENAPKHPIVMRLEGTNSEAARKILEESGVPLQIVNNADDAAKIAVELAKNTPEYTSKTKQVIVPVDSSSASSPQKLPEKVERVRSNSFSNPAPGSASAPPARKRTSSGVFQVDEAEPLPKKVDHSRSNSDGSRNKPEALPNGRRKANNEKEKPQQKEKEKIIVIKFDSESNNKCVSAFKESDSWD